jgi:hypothetical protein
MFAKVSKSWIKALEERSVERLSYIGINGGAEAMRVNEPRQGNLFRSGTIARGNRLVAFIAAISLSYEIALPSPGLGAVLKCGQPVSSGDGPMASDALAVLQASVGLPACSVAPCVCDVGLPQGISTSDALRVLRNAVGALSILSCQCAPCSTFALSATDGGEIDFGWNGKAHNNTLPRGRLFGLAVLHRCGDDGAVCSDDSDCDEISCEPSCDCQSDTTCEIAGPVSDRRCLTTEEICRDNADCGGPCVYLLGPPAPVSIAGNGVCVVSYVDVAVTGTLEVSAGQLDWDALVLRQSHIGISIDQPCPRCGTPEAVPAIGDSFVCEGGSRDGNDCTVDAVDPKFGGTSYDCPPVPSQFVKSVPLRLKATTGLVEREAHFPCFGAETFSHPSRGTGKCLDNDSPCSSNAECTRCIQDPSRPCGTNIDCAGDGPCAQAPDQPVTCGFWCHCGVCDDESGVGCFADSDCAVGVPCVEGGLSQQQSSPNGCVDDDRICGTSVAEQCESTRIGNCTSQSDRICSSDSDCLSAGPCMFEAELACFGSAVSREGSSASFGKACRNAPTASPCSSDAECEAGDECVEAAHVETVAVYCAAPEQAILDTAAGLPGPAAWSARLRVEACACGDGSVGCYEQCDDSNRAPGDGCDAECRAEQ